VIDVALTRAESRSCDVAVVIDVLRATSVATQALAAGYERVLCAESVARAETLRGGGSVLAGEEHCLKPVGFDQGNSPRDAVHRRGQELVLATTNGAPAIVTAARLAPRVLLGCLLNLAAVSSALDADDPITCDVLLVCAGTDGAVALEDTYVAGRLSAGLAGPRTDAARVAEAVALGFPTPLQALEQSADARVLRATGMNADVAYCARESVLDLVPRVISADAGVAVVTGRTASAGTGSLVDLAATVEV
jgi:2-phosphosulfolactate phosphatase